MSFLPAFLIFVGIPVAYVLWVMWSVTHTDAQILRDESMPLPETVVCYQRTFFALTFTLIGVTFAFAGIALVGAVSVMDAAANESLVFRSGVAIVGAFIFASGIYSATRAIRDLFLYSRVSPWGRPILVISCTGFSAFGQAEIPWTTVAKVGTYSVGGRGPTFYWLVLIGNSEGTDNWRFSKAERAYSALIVRGIARQWKIPADNLCAVPIYGTQIEPGAIMILADRYWSEATGRKYKPYSVQLRNPLSA